MKTLVNRISTVFHSHKSINVTDINLFAKYSLETVRSMKNTNVLLWKSVRSDKIDPAYASENYLSPI